MAGQPQPRGTGRVVSGGYVVSGRWSFASGIVHSTWLIGAFKLDSDPDRMLVFVLPKDQAEVIDNWRVAGLQGTGSLDFSADEVFVPQEQTYDLTAAAVRGGDLFRQDVHLFVANEVPPLCIGMARRALDDMTELAGHTARFAGGATLSERPVFRKELGRAEVKVRAARLLHRTLSSPPTRARCSGTAQCAGGPAARRGQRGILRGGRPGADPVVEEPPRLTARANRK